MSLALVEAEAVHHHDIHEIYRRLNATWFRGRVDVEVKWGRAPALDRPLSAIRLGSYWFEGKEISIHPRLDQAFVPRFYVEYVVFHEMLHDVHEMPSVCGRIQFHTAAFLAEERSRPGYQRAEQWGKANLDRLRGGSRWPNL